MSLPVSAAASAPVKIGDILGGKYQVERVLGVGGMGVVVSAKHLTLGERVAIKFLLPQALARNDVVKRFLQEGQAAARLKSEHIARVHDFGQLESGAPFLVMEYLEGSDLSAVLRDRGPLSVETSVDYLLQACEALSEAHSASIIHRDLKPSNLFVIKRLDGTPSIKLIDFGISKVLVPGAGGAEGEMTATAVMMGSPLYMAPEQMVSARDVDSRADIWSLGILLHTMLTGSPPFRAPSVPQLYELIGQGAKPIRKVRADVPEGIEAAILRCLQKDPRQRYADVGELAEAVAAFGPPEARFTANRIRRILVARATQESPPTPAEVPVPVVAVTPAASLLPEVANRAASPASPDAGAPPTSGPPPAAEVSGSSPSSTSSAAIDPLATDGPWDQRTHPPSRRPRSAALIAAAAAVLLGAPVAFLLLRANHGAAVAPPAADSASARPAAVAIPPVESSQPSVAPGAPAVVATADPSPPAEASPPRPRPSVTAAAVTPPARAPLAPRTPPRPHVKSPDDLFGTQK